ncbi:spore germination protein [Paenibacillus sp. NPDC057967]|uniref:spore germination protein n=1 Tax=Paenibacillus sp. NPDC057967 TaxID=3346293 RepID=UPI0036D77344
MKLIDQVILRIGQDSDFMRFPTTMAGESVVLLGYQTFFDFAETLRHLQAQSARIADTDGRDSPPLIQGLGQFLDEPDADRLVSLLMRGQLLIWFEGRERIISFTPTARLLSRNIEAPITESVVRGSISAFVEDMDTNIGLIRKHAAAEDLRTQSYWTGADKQKQIVLIYRERCVIPGLLEGVIQKLEENISMNVQNLQNLSSMLGFNPWTSITKFNSTELPQEVEMALQKGKVVLMLDRFPFALVVPSLLTDMFAVENDRNFPLLFMYLTRFLRIIGVLTNVIIPGLYVSLVSVNPDLLRIEIALTIARSRMDVPYPSLVETLLLLIILELIIEASIRLPKSIGPTLTMVGGIILGQAVVSAKLVSNILIIVLAATTISSSTVVGYHNSLTIRAFKYLILFLSAGFGLYGLVAGLILICAYMASVTSFGIPYVHLMKPSGDSNG